MAIDVRPGQVVGTPEWWLMRLLRKLEARLPAIQVWDDYYEGRQPLAFASDKFREAFGERFPAFTSNFCSLVVDGVSERLEVQGFRFGAPEANTDVWRMWQENDLDSGSQLAHTEAAIKGVAYGLVEPQGGDTPLITIEDACDAIVELDPKRRGARRAGLKRWVDDEGKLVTVLYLPNQVFKYRTEKVWQPYERWWANIAPEASGANLEDQAPAGTLYGEAGFKPYQPPDDDQWPLDNPLGVVPLVELPNRPRLRGAYRGQGQSEIAAVRSNQDAVNKYRCDALIASEFAAFPQRYLLNFEPDVDTDTGRAKEPFRAAIDRLWVVPPPDPEMEGAPEPKFGQFQAASLEPYDRMITLEVGHMSSISRLPYHYLLGTPQTIPPSGESLKSSEAGLEHKVSRTQAFMGEGWEELMRVGLLAQGSPLARERSAETIWVDTETRSEAVRTDAIVKLHAEGIIDDELAWEMAGLSPQQVARLVARRAAAAEAEAEAEPPEAEPNQPPEVVPAPMGPRMGV